MFRYRQLLVLILIIILGFILSQTRIFPKIKDTFAQILFPLTVSFDKVAHLSADFFKTISSISELREENGRLSEENLKLQSELFGLKEVEHENKILSENLGFFKEQKELKLIPAKIILRSPTDFSRYLTINKGSEDGVREGAAVLSSGFMIGTVSSKTAKTSQFFTLSDVSSSVPIVFQESRGTGLLKGSLKGLVAENVPLDIPVKEGEAVVTSGLGGEVPAGIPIGQAGKVISKEGEIFQKIEVSTPISFSKLEIVFVVQSF